MNRIIAKPHRLGANHYIGFKLYFITILCYKRQPFFADDKIVENIKRIYNSSLKSYKFENLLTVFMTDHVHMILKGTSETSNLKKCIKTFKSLTSIEMKKFYYCVRLSKPKDKNYLFPLKNLFRNQEIEFDITFSEVGTKYALLEGFSNEFTSR